MSVPAQETPSAVQRARERARDRDQREAPEVSDLRFQGVSKVEKSELEESIATDQSRCRSLLLTPFCWFSKSPAFYQRAYLDRDELRRDVLRIRVFYWQRGFRHARVDTVVTRDGDEKVKVAFQVNEGPALVVAAFRIGGADTILSPRLVRQLRRKHEGEPLSLLGLDSTVVRVEQALWNEGYADAIVDTTVRLTSEDTARAVVALGVEPRWIARVGSIAIEGNEKVSEDVIRRSLRVKEGQMYRLQDVLASQRALYESNLFQRVAIVVPPQGDSIKALEVGVIEAPPRSARAAGGFNTQEFLQVDGRITHYNFRGRGHRLELRGTLGNLAASQLNGKLIFRDVTQDVTGDEGAFLQPTWRVSGDLTLPWFYAPRNALAFGIFASRRSLPGVVIDRSIGTSATFTREVAERAPASLDYRFEVTDVDAGDVYFCVNFGVCELDAIEALRGRQRLSPLTLTSNIDRSNDPFSPTTGYRARLDLEHASAFTLSEFRHNRLYGEGTIYRRMPGRRATLAFRLRGGAVRALQSAGEALDDDGDGFDARVLHPRKRFYAGGSQSVRGFGENQLGPRILTIPPNRLRGDTSVGGTPRCAAATAITLCDPNAEGIDDEDFTPRPLGANTLLEGSVEWRFPLPLGDAWGAAVFLDGAIVGSGRRIAGNAIKGATAFTPGFGIRYQSLVGPIRVDIGLNPTRAQDLYVVTETTNAEGERQIVQLEQQRRYDPLRPRGRLLDALNRLTFHLAIGQAF